MPASIHRLLIVAVASSLSLTALVAAISLAALLIHIAWLKLSAPATPQPPVPAAAPAGAPATA